MATDTLTDNELIAKFYGAVYKAEPSAFNPDITITQWIIIGNPYNQHRDNIKHWYSPEQLQYHQSWDWIMPVMSKAKSAIKEAGWGTPTEKAALTRLKAALNEVYNINIKNAHFCLVRFIKWYNQQTKTV